MPLVLRSVFSYTVSLAQFRDFVRADRCEGAPATVATGAPNVGEGGGALDMKSPLPGENCLFEPMAAKAAPPPRTPEDTELPFVFPPGPPTTAPPCIGLLLPRPSNPPTGVRRRTGTYRGGGLPARLLSAPHIITLSLSRVFFSLNRN